MSLHLILDRLNRKEPVLLAGACGTEIQRRGVRTELPLWSASALQSAPKTVQDIHRDYILAGADIVSTNTFRTNIRTFRNIGTPELARELTITACELARAAKKEAGRDTVCIGGSVAPVEDCYEVESVPSDEELVEEHGLLVSYLAEGGVDFIFVETMNCIREAVAAARAAREAGLEFALSFVCNQNGDLLSGEPIEEAVNAIVAFRPFALLTNCRPLNVIEASVDRLLETSPVPVGVYANGAGHPDDELGWKFEGENPEHEYCEHAQRWLQDGALIIGGCCGTNPNYVHKLHTLIQSRKHSAT